MYKYINYFRVQENDIAFPPAQYFRSFSFLPIFHIFFFSPIFPIFLPFPLPPFFTDRSFAPRKAQSSLAQEILIFRGAEGARPLCEPWWITAGRYSFRFRIRERVVRRRYNPRFVVETFIIRANDSSNACFRRHEWSKIANFNLPHG